MPATSLDESLLSVACRTGRVDILLRRGVEESDFEGQSRLAWRYLLRYYEDFGQVPSADALLARFPDLVLPTVRNSDLPGFVKDIKQRSKYNATMDLLANVTSKYGHFSQADDLANDLLAGSVELASRNGNKSHLIDPWSASYEKEYREDLRRRAEGFGNAIPTGLPTFDRECGGLQKQRMVVIIGRTRTGKSWLDLLFVATAVLNGFRVILYPLEMTVNETLSRLITIFSSQLFGVMGTLPNFDLLHGKVTPSQIDKFFHTMRDKFPGQLMIASVASLNDGYTVDRIDADVAMHKPDLVWVDYLTLMKTSGSATDDWQKVRQLSHGLKSIAMRRDIVAGCSAQVNREAVKGNTWIPRLEHISYGDSIGQDADQVFSINRNNGDMAYAVVKNRSGPELETTRIKFMPNDGRFEEVGHVEEDEESLSS